MSVTYYSRANPHKGGFIGFRVAVMVNMRHRQRYFSTKNPGDYDHQFKLAHKLNEKWLEEKEKADRKRSNAAIPTIRNKYSTGVRGVSIKYTYSRDRKGNRQAYRHLKLVVQGSHNCVLFKKDFPPTQQGWIDAVTYLAKKKHLTRWRHLLDRYEGSEVLAQ